jgi:ABC-type nitrate/sulfonate/bicarbonate transport system substrate-binding protein
MSRDEIAGAAPAATRTVHAVRTSTTPVPAVARTAAPSVTGLAARLGWLDAGPLAGHARWLREGDNVTALHARSAGRPTRLVGLTWIDGYQGVLALPGAGIEQPAQLQGRRLALPALDPGESGARADVRRAAASRGFHAATALACLFSDEYDFADVSTGAGTGTGAGQPYAEETAALLRGEVDAIYVAGAAGRAVAERIGAVEVVDLGAHLDPAVRVNATTPAAITVDEELLRREPHVVVELLAALLRAGDWAERQPAAIAAAYGVRGSEQQFHVDLSAHKLAALSAQNDFLRAHRFLAEGEVDLAAWADPAPLAAARELVAAQGA